MVGARPPVVAMAAAGCSVVRRVEELGDLAQAHIQQLSEAAGEDGEGAEERAAGLAHDGSGLTLEGRQGGRPRPADPGVQGSQATATPRSLVCC